MLQTPSKVAQNNRTSTLKNQNSKLLFGSMNNLSQFMQKKEKITQTSIKKTVFLAESQIESERKIYQWRLKTQFPIVKVLNLQIFERKLGNEGKSFQINMQISTGLKPISCFQNISFNQSLYVLKQALIGFQSLYHRFGILEILPSMIFINKNNKCKVWINNDLSSNKVIKTQSTNTYSKSQAVMVQTIIQIIRKITPKIGTSQTFFQKVMQIEVFNQSLKFIEKYCEQLKIVIPQSLITFKNQSNKRFFPSVMLKCSLNLKEPVKNQKQKINISSKIPSFIKHMNSRNLNQSEQQYVFERSQTNKSQKIQMDRSMTNISRNFSTNSLVKESFFQRKNSLLQKKRISKQSFDNQKFWQKMNIQEKIKCQNQNVFLNIEIPKKLTSQSFYQSGSNSPVCPNSPVSPISPLLSLQTSPHKNNSQQINNAQEENISNYSFNDKSNNFKSFEAAQNMFLTVIQNNKNKCNLSKISSHTVNNPSKRTFLKLHQMKQGYQCLSEDSDQNDQKNNPKQENLSREFYFTEQKNVSPKIQNLKIKKEDARLRKVSQDITNFVNKKSCPASEFFSRKHQSQEYITIKINNRDTQDCEQNQQQSATLRETIMGKNGWKNLSLFDKNQMNESIIQGGQIQVKYKYTTLQLQKLGAFGRDLVSSMIEDDQNLEQIDLKYRIRIKKERQHQILNVLL